MDDGCRCNQGIDVAARPDGCDPSPLDRNLICHWKNAIGMVMAQLAQPLGKMPSRFRIRFLLERDTAHDLAEGEGAEVNACGIHRAQSTTLKHLPDDSSVEMKGGAAK